MRRSIGSIVTVLAALALAGCPAKPKDGECKTSEDCAAQAGQGRVCVQGRCQECGQDGECRAGFVCTANRCTPRPECSRDDECPSGRTCQSGKCVAPPAPAPECTTDAACGEGKACKAGKCVVAVAPACPFGGGNLLPVYFAFDRAVLTPESQAELARNADCIRDRKFTRITIQGNCDERGTAEYNLQLGQRRAEAAKKYLVHLGVPAKSIKAVSLGKERPVCGEATEACWARNRRDDVIAQ